MNEEIVEETIENDDNLATRWQRLWASMIDSLTVMIISIPLMYFTGIMDKAAQGVQPSFFDTIWIMLIAVGFFAAINYKLLITKGQTIGKKILKVKIVDLDTQLPTPKSLLTRYAVFFGLGQIPLIGPIANTINALFIFGKEKRCGHDYIAKTKVVKA